MSSHPHGGTVLVLGGTGFVGRHMCAALAQAGYDVLAVAKHPAKNMPAVRFIPLDLAEAPPATLTDLIRAESPVTLVNAAGGIWGLNEDQMREGNVLLVERMLTALRLLGTRLKLVQIGTIMEYGPITPGVPIAETAPTEPGTVYGRTKLRATELVLAANRERLVDAVVLRVSNVSGPGSPQRSLLGLVADHLVRAAEGAPAVVPLSPLTAERDYIDVRDVADAVVAAVRADLPAGQVINIGRGESVGVRSLVHRLIEISGVPAEVREQAASPAGRTDYEWLRADIGTARALLDWRPGRDLDDSLRDLWQETLAGC
jgi:dTDP-6-deoxy-L-talose 4-dehydrogenase [NAD(P)+]